MMIDQKVREAASVPSPTLGREILWLSAAGWMRRLFGGSDVPLADGAGPVSHLLATLNPFALNTWCEFSDADARPLFKAMHSVYYILECLADDAPGGWTAGNVLRFHDSGLKCPIQYYYEDADIVGANTQVLAADVLVLGAAIDPTKWKLLIYGVW